jgi:tetratricopeptide (TPR) repeat protein
MINSRRNKLFATATMSAALLCLGVAFSADQQGTGSQCTVDEKERRVGEALSSAARLISQHRRVEAKDILSGIDETYPNDRRVTMLLSDLERLDKRWKRALDLLVSAGYEKLTDGGDRYIRVGYLLTKLGRHAEARKMWEPQLVVRSGYPEWSLLLPDTKTAKGLEASWLIALSYNVFGRSTLDDPNSIMVEALRLAPGNPIAAGYLALSAYGNQKYRDAVRFSDIALAGCPEGMFRDALFDTRKKAAAMIR